MNIKKHLEQLKDFQTSFNSTYNTTLTFQEKQTIDLRINMFDEEAEEFLKFFRLKNKVEILDAISDELFLLYGDIVTVGVIDGFEEKYLELKEQFFNEAISKYEEDDEFAPKVITLDILNSSLGMLDFIKNEISDSLTEDEFVEFNDIAMIYFFNRLLLLEVKGFYLYGDDYGTILDEALTTVYESNMSKLDENKKPIINGENGYLDNEKPLGKVLKSKQYWQPTDKLNDILSKYNK